VDEKRYPVAQATSACHPSIPLTTEEMMDKGFVDDREIPVDRLEGIKRAWRYDTEMKKSAVSMFPEKSDVFWLISEVELLRIVKHDENKRLTGIIDSLTKERDELTKECRIYRTQVINSLGAKLIKLEAENAELRKGGSDVAL
jgi:hypothetical protein